MPAYACAQRDPLLLKRAVENYLRAAQKAEEAALRLNAFAGFVPHVAVGLPGSTVASRHALVMSVSSAHARQINQIRLSRFNQGKFPDKTHIDAVIFDMDGTLLNSLSAWEHASANYLRTRGIEIPAEMEARLEHMSLMEGALYIKEQLGLPDKAEDLLAAVLAPIHQQYLTSIEAKPGAKELVKRLKAQGIKIAVATAANTELARGAFARTGLLPYFDFMIDCNEVGVGKRSPAVYEKAANRLGTAKERTLVVEDALYALQTAKRAGFLTAGVADAHYDKLHEMQVRQTGDYFFTSFEDSLK